MSNRVAYLKTLKQAKLRGLCRVLNLPVGGSKVVLATRIAAREAQAGHKGR